MRKLKVSNTVTTRQTAVRVNYRGVWVPTYLLPHKEVMKLGKIKLYVSQPLKRKTGK